MIEREWRQHISYSYSPKKQSTFKYSDVAGRPLDILIPGPPGDSGQFAPPPREELNALFPPVP